MEQSPQIHKQEAESPEAGEFSAANKEPLAATAQDNLKKKLVEVWKSLDTAVADGTKTAEEAQAALLQLDSLAKELTGRNIEEINKEYLFWEDGVLDELERLHALGTHDSLLADGLAGFDSDRAWQFRSTLRGDYIVQGLAGVDSDKAWEMREDPDADEVEVALSLAGLDSERAWDKRKSLETTTQRKELLLNGITGVDSPRAWEMREKYLEEKGYAGRVAISLAGLDSDEAWEMRDRLLADGVDRDTIVTSLTGLDSEEAWELREKFLAEGLRTGTIFKSLAGIDSPKAWQMRDELIEKGTEKGEIARGLAGLSSIRAENLRRKIEKERNRHDIQILGNIALGFNGHYTSGIAWRAAKGLLPYQLEKKE